ncbi:MAG TPA: hypothetical protein VGP95_01240 [Gemmatimonadaceae bacterium]|nr:hypothetical protein [Gemmatimonadaceae bacterium]
MLLLFGAAFALYFQGSQQPPTPRSKRLPVVRDSAAVDTGSSNQRRRTQGHRRAVTAELSASAFKDATAKITLTKAREARLTQDSALVAYDAMSHQRLSVGMGFGRIGRDRLLFRHEAASRVRWQRDVGVWVDVKGVRTAVPMVARDEASKEFKREIRNEMNDPDLMGEIPYYPGYEPLWIGGGNIARTQVDESEIVNPVADGAEAYYTYQTGDSISFRLPDGKTVQLRELKIRPRQPKWNLSVGSLWFDTKSGQLVRAAYRMSVPMDIWAVATEEDPKSMDDVPVWVKPMITPMKAEVSAIAIEYGLYEGRFWLPRVRLAEGEAQVSFMHVPFKMQESFNYASVNAKDSLPPIRLQSVVNVVRPPDSLDAEGRAAWRDSVRLARRARIRAENDSIRQGLKVREPRVTVCDTAETRVSTSRRYEGTLAIAMRIPCDPDKLEHSPELPASIYDPGEEVFSMKDLDELKQQALSLAAQAPLSFHPQFWPPPSVSYGPALMRYNRVEGFSAGISVEQQLGGGYAASAVGRIGLADLEPNVELGITRSNLVKSVSVRGYNHLVSASDWGQPLSFSSSFSALMFGRDEGFYYRATGAELSGTREAGFGGGTHVEWRTFVEQERNAAVKTSFAVNGADFPANIAAWRGSYQGAAIRFQSQHGLDPRGLRLFSDLRLEAAHGDSLYGRGALDLTASHGLGRLAGALTLSGGSSLGALPPQRLWYLGGSKTIRGQSPSPDSTQSGNAYWLTRLEIGANDAGMRPTVFGDLGWVGDRNHMTEHVKPMSGVGVGVSFLDGMFRFDVARGIYPKKQFRVDLSLESVF